MASNVLEPNNTYPLLDQLQNEVNTVIEHTARLLAASADSSKSVPIAHASKLKKIVPECMDRFHTALDELEDQLQLAKLVMRRDLAILRGPAVQDRPAQVQNGPQTSAEDSKEPTTEETTERAEPMKIDGDGGDVDVSMQDAQPEAETVPENLLDQSKADDHEANIPDSKPAVNKVSSPEQAEPAKAEQQLKNELEKSAEPPLQIHTNADPTQASDNTNDQQSASDTKPPDTALSTTAELDSLFGGPTSAIEPDSAQQQEFNFEDTNNEASNNDFDFSSFLNNNNSNPDGGNDTDDVSSLLPGLQDYANTQPGDGGDPDFDAIFGDVQDSAMEGGNSGHVGDGLDALMDFTGFGDENGQVRNADAHQNEEFDFDFA